MFSEKEKFLSTVCRDIENGLVDIRFQRASNGAQSSEEVYGEINAMWNSKNTHDTNSEEL